MSSKNSQSDGIGLCGFTFLIFLVLKLTGTGVVAQWSWWAVTAPLWVPFAIVVGMLALILIAVLVAKMIERVI